MASFISAGHHNKDSGAIGSGTQENWEAKKFRDLVVPHAKKLGVKVITDDDNETLSEYLKRIQSGSGSVVVEFHFDAANGTASGSTAIVGVDADRLDKSFAQELVDLTAKILGIKNRGVKSEAQSHRGRLGLMREQGIVCLFITDHLCVFASEPIIILFVNSIVCGHLKIGAYQITQLVNTNDIFDIIGKVISFGIIFFRFWYGLQTNFVPCYIFSRSAIGFLFACLFTNTYQSLIGDICAVF
jgi:N-acetylmuramoyl-L-alanine amidase